jgi:hypothetical protein
MPTVFNPSAFNLWCEAADQEIPAGKTVDVSEEVADRVSTCVFIVTGEAPVVETKTEKAPATRKTTTRGSKRAEVTEAPEVETRTW